MLHKSLFHMHLYEHFLYMCEPVSHRSICAFHMYECDRFMRICMNIHYVCVYEGVFHLSIWAFHVCEFSEYVCESFKCEYIMFDMCLCNKNLKYFLNGPSYITQVKNRRISLFYSVLYNRSLMLYKPTDSLPAFL